jgi:hypothetical protein
MFYFIRRMVHNRSCVLRETIQYVMPIRSVNTTLVLYPIVVELGVEKINEGINQMNMWVLL